MQGVLNNLIKLGSWRSKEGLVSRVAVNKPLLRNRNVKRLRFAKNYTRNGLKMSSNRSDGVMNVKSLIEI